MATVPEPERAMGPEPVEPQRVERRDSAEASDAVYDTAAAEIYDGAAANIYTRSQAAVFDRAEKAKAAGPPTAARAESKEAFLRRAWARAHESEADRGARRAITVVFAAPGAPSPGRVCH